MSDLKVVRQDVTASFASFDFDKVSSAFLVKNFSSDAILVAFDEDAEDGECIKIAKGMGQLCLVNMQIPDVMKRGTIWVKGDGDGEVEVQAVCY